MTKSDDPYCSIYFVWLLNLDLVASRTKKYIEPGINYQVYF